MFEFSLYGETIRAFKVLPNGRALLDTNSSDGPIEIDPFRTYLERGVMQLSLEEALEVTGIHAELDTWVSLYTEPV